MDRQADSRWFTKFQIEPDDRPDEDAIWVEMNAIPKPSRRATAAEKRSILLIGIAAIGWIVVMVVILIVAVIVTRN